MQIQVNTDNNIEGREQLASQVRALVESALDRFRDRITRIEAHISDQNGDKSGPADKRCMLEARLEGRPPTTVSHEAASVQEAVEGAADKLARVVGSSLGRLHDQALDRTDPAPPEPTRPKPREA